MDSRVLSRLTQLIWFILPIFLGISLIIYLLQDKLAFYYTTSEVINLKPTNLVKVGGKIKVINLAHFIDEKIEFIIVDEKGSELVIRYCGIIPALFRINQGVVASGILNKEDIFIAKELLIKHDEYYYPN